MSDYSTIRSLTSSTSLKNIKPVVYKELNNVRLLPNGWEDEILKISNSFGVRDRRRRCSRHNRCLGGAKENRRRRHRGNENNETTTNKNQCAEEVIRHSFESSSSSSKLSSEESSLPSSCCSSTLSFIQLDLDDGERRSSTTATETKQQKQRRRLSNCYYSNSFKNDRKGSQRKTDDVVVEEERERSSSSSSSSSFSPKTTTIRNQNVFVLHALKLAFKLALKERDTLASALENFVSSSNYNKRIIKENNMKTDSINSTISPTTATFSNGHVAADTFINNPLSTSVDSMTASSLLKLNNKENEINSLIVDETTNNNNKPVPLSASTQDLSEVLIEPVDEEAEEVSSTWEYRNVSLARVPGYGFGIAVSGGRDNPHFKNGDPSIVVSDVLRAGPAYDVLLINDRIVSANGFNLDNADYATAVQIMKDSEHLNLVIKRRIRLPVLEYEQRTLKFTLSKSKKKDDFGVVLGCKFFIKEITNKKLADKEPGLKENDVVTSINGQRCDDMTLSDARKLLEKSKERLSLIVERDVPRGANWKWSSQATLYERLGSDTPRQSPTPRASPMVNSRYSNDGDNRLNNGFRLSNSYLNRVTPPASSMDYVASSMKRQSYGSNRSRTPNASISDDYSNGLSPKVANPPSQFSVASPKESIGSNYGTLNDSAADHNQNSPCCSSEPRFVTFMKENGSVGVRVIGGNEVGIFVSAVQPGSPAFVQGVRCGDQILKVNDKDMINVTREEAVLHLLSLSDRIDLLVQYKRDQYEYLRLNNLGDNFFVRVHFDYDQPENGELSFKKGDVFQIIDTLFGGTVGSWQAVSVVSNDKIPVKGVIPNATRADNIISNDPSRTSTRRFDDNRTGSLLRKKMSLGRRSKSLTKSRLDEVVFAQDNFVLRAYERVKLKRPEFLRPVVLFGPLADVSREKLLQDYPLRFATPQHESADDESNNKKCGIIRLSSIKEIMNKNKHCLLDITPSSVEKLQYAQYCPIVVFLNVDARTRLKELRRKHSKAAATKSSRKLMDDSAKIQKSYNYLFTAVLDASREDEWFDGLLDLISGLQDSRIWMGETRPANILDDEFLFPFDYRYGNYSTAGESDAESVKTDHFDYRTLPARHQFGRGSNKNGSSEWSVARRNDHDYGDYAPSDEAAKMTTSMISSIDVYDQNDRTSSSNMFQSAVDLQGNVPLYENHDRFVDHFATLRRPTTSLPRPKVKPIPPPRQFNYPSSMSPTQTPTGTNNVRTQNGGVNYNSQAPLNLSSSNVASTSSRFSKSPAINGPRTTFRQISEPGMFDVKQILVDNSEKNCNFSPPPPPPPDSKIDNVRTYNGYVSRNDLGHLSYPRRMSHSEVYATTAMTNSYCSSPSNSSAQPIAIINPSFQDAAGSPVGGRQASERSNFVARTASMPLGASRIKQNGTLSTNGGGVCLDYDSKPRPPMPPPAPAPRSPHHQHSPKLSLPSTNVVSVNFENERASSPPQPVTSSRNAEIAVDSSKTANNISNEMNTSFNESSYRPILNGHIEGSVSSHKRPIKSPKPPVPEKPVGLSSTSLTNVDLGRGRGSAFELYKSPNKSANDNRTVLAHVTAFVGPDGGVLTSDTTGVVLKIPPGALTTKHDVFFKVFQDSLMEPPLDKEKGETLLSPLLMCGPQGLKFQKPVELLLPHCASDTDDDVRWSFALKSANDAGVGVNQTNNWKQIPLSDANVDRNGGLVNGKYVSITIDHF